MYVFWVRRKLNFLSWEEGVAFTQMKTQKKKIRMIATEEYINIKEKQKSCACVASQS